MISLKSEHKFNITGRGDVYTIDLKENNIPQLRKEFGKDLMKKNVLIDGKEYFVWGIEAFATGESYVHQKIGLLVKNVNS